MTALGNFFRSFFVKNNHWQTFTSNAPIIKQDPDKLAVLRFFFDYGAGGCLWNGDKSADELFGYGPLDCFDFDLEGNLVKLPSILLSQTTRLLVKELSDIHYHYLNPEYPPDPSLWRQSLCDEFNQRIDELLERVTNEIGDKFEIIDRQTRFVEDENLDDYLKKNPQLSDLHSFADVKLLIKITKFSYNKPK